MENRHVAYLYLNFKKKHINRNIFIKNVIQDTYIHTYIINDNNK